MPENAGVQCDCTHIRIEQERLALENTLRENQARVAQVERRLALLSRELPSPPPLPNNSPRSRNDGSDTPDVSDSPDVSFPAMSTYLPSRSESSPQAAATQSTISRSKLRRERRKKLKAARTPLETLAPIIPPEEPSAKNSFGIISIRRKDFKPLSQDDYVFLIENITKHVSFTDITQAVSLYKDYLRIFCDSKEKLQLVYNCSKLVPVRLDNPGFLFALPGVKFSDVRRIECRLPCVYNCRQKFPMSRIVSWFLAGLPKHCHQSHAKFVKTFKLKSCTDCKKNVVLVLEVSESIIDFLRSKHFVVKLDRKYRVKWHLHNREKGFNNKVYTKVENISEYWERKRIVGISGSRKHVNPCLDLRIRLDFC